MGEDHPDKDIKADLQTAQNRMLPFVSQAMDLFEKECRAAQLLENPGQLEELYGNVQQQLFNLLNLPEDQRDAWYMGIADSGKRTIDILVDLLCPAEAGQNALLDTENYVGFNKFSAATALEKQKGIPFEKPFSIELGRALTINSDIEFEKLSRLFRENRFKTLWVSWNSTSTGVRENIEEIVKCRNTAQSKTLIIADAASKHLFSNEWKSESADHLPDVFFFSMRKQGLPYEGPNDEFHQAQNSGALIVFNDKALQWSKGIESKKIYDCPTFSEFADGQLTHGPQRKNHVKHLLKLNCAFDFYLGRDRERIIAFDARRKAARLRIMEALAKNGDAEASDFKLLSDPDAQSESAYILRVPEGTTAKKVVSGLKENGILISPCMHPEMDGKKYVRFAFYPGNSAEEVEYLLQHITS